MLNVETMEPLLTQLADRIAAKMAEPVTVTTITFGELFDLYLDKHALVRIRCVRNLVYFYKSNGSRWRDVQIHQISRKAVQEWVDEMGAESRTKANRYLTILSSVINWGIRRDYLVSIANPCVGVERFPTVPRDRFAAPNELTRLTEALKPESSSVRDFFWLCLLTGARRGNLLTMRWDEIDLDLAIWNIPAEKFKNGTSHVLPLTSEAMIILRRRLENGIKSPWVFPGRFGSDRPRVDVKRAWGRVLKRAAIKNLRIHDLRRTLASYMAINGQSQYVIARMLGHTDTRSTDVYAKLNMKAVRDASQAVSDDWQQILNKLPEEKLPQNSTVAIAPLQLCGGTEARLSAVEQLIVESKIIACINSGHGFKKAFWKRIGAHAKLNGGELERILKGLIERQLIDCYLDDIGTWRYSLSNSGTRAS